jgi:hypothetical protein
LNIEEPLSPMTLDGLSPTKSATGDSLPLRKRKAAEAGLSHDYSA